MAETIKKLSKATALGIGAAIPDLVATTGWMHRAETHRAWTPSKAVQLVARTILWQGTGIKPREWAAVHRIHHELADQPGDPHSPIVESDGGHRNGVLRVLIRNPLLYRDKVREIRERPLPADLQPDGWDRKIFDNAKTGVAVNILGHIAANKAIGNPAYMAGASFLVEKATYLLGGNAVNSIGHGGKHPVKALFTGRIDPQDDGTYGADSTLVGSFTFGEGNQGHHHLEETDVYFGDTRQGVSFLRDPVGALVLRAAQRGYIAPVPQMQRIGQHPEAA